MSKFDKELQIGDVVWVEKSKRRMGIVTNIAKQQRNGEEWFAFVTVEGRFTPTFDRAPRRKQVYSAYYIKKVDIEELRTRINRVFALIKESETLKQ